MAFTENVCWGGANSPFCMNSNSWKPPLTLADRNISALLLKKKKVRVAKSSQVRPDYRTVELETQSFPSWKKTSQGVSFTHPATRESYSHHLPPQSCWQKSSLASQSCSKRKIVAADILQVDWSRHLQKAEDWQIVLSTGTTTAEHYPFTPSNRNGTALQLNLI